MLYTEWVMTPLPFFDGRPSAHRRFRVSPRTSVWAVGFLLAALAMVAASQFTRHVASPAWLRLSVSLFVAALGLIAAVMLLFSLGRDWLGKTSPEAAGDTGSHRRGLM